MPSFAWQSPTRWPFSIGYIPPVANKDKNQAANQTGCGHCRSLHNGRCALNSVMSAMFFFHQRA
jgi:hypothetical protein